MRKAEDPTPHDPTFEGSDAFARTSDPLNEPRGLIADQPTAEVPLSDAVQTVIGRFRLLEKIGEGGFGAVYVAEQKYPIKRRVALKIIKLGMDTKEVIARFEAERQALAMMDHPNIAKVFDAGATDTGRPYFAMELVRGIPITEYCDQNHLPPVQRLNLFIRVCHAIQHAHQKGIIHRDIKPSNILVTMHDGVPVPKVIDFGIAKATQGELTDKTIYTQFQQFVGTPAYMSPEQAEMSALDIDTRSDIYSLGVLLYELLTGTTPFDAKELMKAGMDEMRRRIRETDPARPSMRISGMIGDASSTTAKRRGMEPQRLISLLRGDLDWVVMKCLEKDRTRRYETANGLAMDVQRHLDNEPISARPPSRLYRFQKSIRRNKLGFGAAMAVLLALVLGVLMSSWQAVRATAARSREAQQRQVAQANEKKALEAQESESAARQLAQAQELAARRRAYAADMCIAADVRQTNLGRARDLLDHQRPRGDEPDLRGWEWRYLWQQTRSDALSTLCKKSEIESIATSSDGHWLAIGLVHKGGISVWDLQSRQEVAAFSADTLRCRVAFCPAEPLLACIGTQTGELRKSSVTLWNPITRQTQREFVIDGDGACVAFSGDGQRLVTATAIAGTAGDRGKIELWRVSDGTRVSSYSSDHFEANRSCTGFAATGDLGIAVFDYGSGKIAAVDLRKGESLWTAETSDADISAIAFSPDEKTLATATGFNDSDIVLRDVATGKETGRLKGHGTWVGSIVFWPDGKRLASASADQTIRTWDLTTGTCTDVLRGHRSEVWRLALLPDEKTLISGCKDGEVCLWDTSVTHPRRERLTLPDNVITSTFSPDSRFLLEYTTEGQILRRSGRDFEHKEILLDTGEKARVSYGYYCCFSPDARFFACGSHNARVSVWDLSRRALVRSFNPGENRVGVSAFLDNGNRLLLWMSNEAGRGMEWDLAANRQVSSWSASPYSSWILSPDQRRVLEIGEEGDVVARDLNSQATTALTMNIVEISDGAFDPSGRWVALGSMLGYARVWETNTWREVATLTGFLNSVNGASFSPSSDRLATAASNADETLKLWMVDGWHEVITLRVPGHDFSAVQFSPDGNTVMIRGSFVELWQAPSWEEITKAEAK